MKNVIHASRSIQDTLIVTHITNIKLQFVASVLLTHVILFFFVPAEDADFGDICSQKALQYGIPKRAGPASNHKRSSEERRVGNECVRTCSSRWSPDN